MMIKIYGERFTHLKLISKAPHSWKNLPVTEAQQCEQTDISPARPSFVDDMIEHSRNLYRAVQEKVSIAHMRVDFFVFDNQFTFAELTFAHLSCSPMFTEEFANKFYGFVASHPELKVDPDDIFEVAMQQPVG